MAAEGLFIVNEIIVLTTHCCPVSVIYHMQTILWALASSVKALAAVTWRCVNKTELCRLQHDEDLQVAASQRVPRSLMISDCCNEQIYLFIYYLMLLSEYYKWVAVLMLGDMQESYKHAQ